MGVESRYGLKFGYMDHGPRNLITDVPGVRVGHVTLHDGEGHTGVTAIIPHTGDVFHEKCLAGAHVINGFGKSIGLVQVQELGTLETPILLTNTLSVGTKLGGYSQDWGKCFPNARVVQMNYVKDLEKEIYGFKRVEQISIAYYGGNKIFDLSIYKDTLKRLDVANSWQDLQQNSNPLEEMTTLKTIDISHMRKLETLEACNAGSLERLVVKDSKGKCELNKLKTIHLVNNKIKSLNLSVVPNLEEVYVGGKLTNLNINQCKRLKKLLIDSNSLKKLIIKNRSLKYLDVSSKVIQKINVTGCPNLIGVTIDRKSKASMGNLDLSKNKKLVYFHANRNARFKKIILPKLSNSKQLNTSYKQYDRAEKCRYTGYGITVDVSKYRKMPVKVKKYQVKTLCNSTTKRLVINKKLRKADKKWIKKFAKKWHVKVVEK